MKITTTAAIAFLGLPVALAAIASPFDHQDASPTRPDPAVLLPTPSEAPPAAPTTKSTAGPFNLFNINQLLQKIWQTPPTSETNPLLLEDTTEVVAPHDLLKPRALWNPSSSHSLPLINTFTTLTSPGRIATRTSHTAKAITPAASSSGAGVTRLAVFTVAGLPWTVTSAHSVEAVDGFTLTPGGPGVNLAGQQVSVGATGGPVLVGGEKVSWTTVSRVASSSEAASSSAGAGSSAGVGGSSSSMAASSGMASASGNGGGGGGSSSSTGGAAMKTAAVGIVLGAMVGAVVL
ncbi:uncharacterized protein LTR77_002277 [Saxophila tyrrhenica]|uniref:Uncharacterized protein n=1 Tax=Saxophila tyrrhenica TaxID=1690608 RepID=A0AAV9PMW7_9PEZI|nr:hypothetical protein LTR77_002277 [Saxophila tyrrhenica]